MNWGDVCLYVGRTTRDPIFIARSYVTTRPWGARIDHSRMVKSAKTMTDAQSTRQLESWVKRYRPMYRAQAPAAVRTPSVPRELSLVERAALAQARSREYARIAAAQ